MDKGDFISAYEAFTMDHTYGNKCRKLDVPYNVSKEDCLRLKPVFDRIREVAHNANCIRVKCDLRDYDDNKDCSPRDVLIDLQEQDKKALKELGYSLHYLAEKEWYGAQYNLCWIGSMVSPYVVMKYYRYKASQRTPEQNAKLDKCVVCKTKPADFFCDPCEHKCICDTCCEKVNDVTRKCPICDKFVRVVCVNLNEL